MDLSEPVWSQSEASTTCFLVLDSQEEESQPTQGLGVDYGKLKALNQAQSMPVAQEGTHGRSRTGKEAAGGRSTRSNQQRHTRGEGTGRTPGDGEKDDGGDNVPSHGSAAGGSGGGGGGGRDDDKKDDSVHDDSEHEEDDTREETPSSHESLPVLVTASATAEDNPTAGGGASPRTRESLATSESEGGVSDAPTAIVSDTEGHGQVIEQRSQERREQETGVEPVSGAVGSPHHVMRSQPTPKTQGGVSSPRVVRSQPTPPRGYSSTSTLSSFSSSDNEANLTKSVVRKKLMSKRKPGEDQSSSTDTSTEQPGGQSKTRNPPTTPSKYLGSLQFSGQATLVPDSEVDDLGSEMCIPPSQDAYGDVPLIIPSSPTEQSFSPESDSQGNVTVIPAEMTKSGTPVTAREPVRANSGSSSGKSAGFIPTFSAPSVQSWQPLPSLSVSEESLPSTNTNRRGSAAPSPTAAADQLQTSRDSSVSMHLQLSFTEQSEASHPQAAEEAAVPSESQDLALHYSPSQHTEVSQHVSPAITAPTSTPGGSHGSSGSHSTGRFHMSLPREDSDLRPRSLVTPPSVKYQPTGVRDSPTEPPEETSHTAESSLADVAKPSLALDMIDQSEESPASLPQFHLDRPTLETSVGGDEDSRTTSVFDRARQRQQQQPPGAETVQTHDTLDSDDPYAFPCSQRYITKNSPEKGRKEQGSEDQETTSTSRVTEGFGLRRRRTLEGDDSWDEEIQFTKLHHKKETSLSAEEDPDLTGEKADVSLTAVRAERNVQKSGMAATKRPHPTESSSSAEPDVSLRDIVMGDSDKEVAKSTSKAGNPHELKTHSSTVHTPGNEPHETKKPKSATNPKRHNPHSHRKTGSRKKVKRYTHKHKVLPTSNPRSKVSPSAAKRQRRSTSDPHPLVSYGESPALPPQVSAPHPSGAASVVTGLPTESNLPAATYTDSHDTAPYGVPGRADPYEFHSEETERGQVAMHEANVRREQARLRQENLAQHLQRLPETLQSESITIQRMPGLPKSATHHRTPGRSQGVSASATSFRPGIVGPDLQHSLPVMAPHALSGQPGLPHSVPVAHLGGGVRPSTLLTSSHHIGLVQHPGAMSTLHPHVSTVTTSAGDNLGLGQPTSVPLTSPHQLPSRDSSFVQPHQKSQSVQTASEEGGSQHREGLVQHRIYATYKMAYCQTIHMLHIREGDNIVRSEVLGTKTDVLSNDVTVDDDIISTPSPSRSYKSLSSGDLGDISSLSRSSSVATHSSGSLNASLSKSSSSSHHTLSPPSGIQSAQVTPTDVQKQTTQTSTTKTQVQTAPGTSSHKHVDIGDVAEKEPTRRESDGSLYSNPHPRVSDVSSVTSEKRTSNEFDGTLREPSDRRSSSSLFSTSLSTCGDKRLSRESSVQDRRSSESLFSNVSLGKRTSSEYLSSKSSSSLVASLAAAEGVQVEDVTTVAADEVEVGEADRTLPIEDLDSTLFQKPLPPKDATKLRKSHSEESRTAAHRIQSIQEMDEPGESLAQQRQSAVESTSTEHTKLKKRRESSPDVDDLLKQDDRGQTRGASVSAVSEKPDDDGSDEDGNDGNSGDTERFPAAAAAQKAAAYEGGKTGPKSSRQGRSRKGSEAERTLDSGTKSTPKRGRAARKDSSVRKQIQLASTGEAEAEDPQSKEVPVEGGEEEEVIPDVQETSMEETSSLLATGTPVHAMWKDKFFYPGHIVKLEKNGKYEVVFEDGDSRQVKPSDLILIDLVDVGEEVMAEREDDWSEKAIVVQHKYRAGKAAYIVEFEDGNTRSLNRGNVHLSHEQATTLRRPSLCPAPPVDCNANVSLDNLMDGKRRRSDISTTPVKRGQGAKGAAEEGSSNQKGKAGAKSSTKRGKGSAAKGRGGKSGAGRKRGEEEADEPESATKKTAKRKLEPQATSTPTPKRPTRQKPEAEAAASPLHNVFDSPQFSKPRKTYKAALFANEKKGPIPPSDSQLFLDMAFLLTHVERTEEQKRRDRKLSRDISADNAMETDESSNMEEEDDCPFDKEHLTRQIVAGGGLVLDPFNMDEVSAAGQCFLISDTYQRTQKYFQALAAGIKCVSHLWIRDCCAIGHIQDYRSYMLPAGLNIECNRLVEWNDSHGCLSGLNVLLASTNKRFLELWGSVLQVAGCQTRSKLQARPQPKDIEELDVVVADRSIPHSTLRLLTEANKLIVSSEWVIQCLIQGQRCNVKASPRYLHTSS